MKIIKIVAVSAAAIACGSICFGQDAWSLEQCVAYAVEHNLTVRQSQLQVVTGELSVTEAKDRFLPTVNASAGQSWNFGRGLTVENTYANRNTTNFQWGANLNLPLFQGLSDFRQLKVAKSNLTKLLYDFEAAKDNISLNIISQYLQVLYAKEVLASSRSQLEYSTFEVDRQRALVDAGKVAEADLYDAESQAAQDRLTVVTAENDVQTALVELANLLQLPSAQGFDILPIDEGEPIIPTADAVYSAALNHNNSVLSSRQNIEVADNNISLAKSGYLPTLSFGSSIGSSYYTISGMRSDAFGDQMRHNLSTYVGFNLSVPIFNAFSTRNNVRRAKIQKIQAELALDQTQTELFKTIQLAYYQAKGSRDKYFTSLETLEKTRLSFEATQEKYSLGRSTPSEFEIAKNNLFRTEINSIQAHYEYLLRYRILMFYQSNHI